MSNRADTRSKFFASLASLGKSTVTKAEIKSICSELGISGAQFFTKDENNRIGRGLYKVPSTNIEMVEIGRAHV